MINKEISFEERQLRRRNRKVNSLRFKQGFNELKRKRIKRIIFYIFIFTTLISWNLFVYKPINNLDIFRLLIYIAYWLIDSICLFGLIIWFGTPKNYRMIEDDIKDIFDIKESHKIPILKSNIKSLQNNDYTYSFYSPDFPEEKYEEKRNEIEQKLGIEIQGPIVDNNGYVSISYVPKKKIKKMGELIDDRI